MSGKVHAGIGLVCSVLLCAVIVIVGHAKLSLELLLLLSVGSIVGSLVVDIDSKKSKASQKFTKVIVVLVWAFLISTMFSMFLPNISDYSGISQEALLTGKSKVVLVIAWVLNKAMYLVDSKFFLLALCVLITLGKMSPHRQFTHKWFGTSLFLIVGYLAFTKYLAIGYMLGYVLHLVADSTTKAGLPFLEFSLPCQKSNGKFHFHF